jgi:hypothetical protein
MNDPIKQPTEPTGKPESEGAEEQLGDAGKRALDAERKARREAERQAREANDRATELEGAELRRSVAAEKGLSDDQAKFLSGSSREEMIASADELLEAFKSEGGDSVARLPRERLKPGAAPGAEPKDFGAVADRVRRGP